MSLTYNFKGQVALVTGAAAGIGFAAAEAFTEAGAAVVLVDVDEDALRSATQKLLEGGRQAAFFRCDVSDEAQVSRMVSYVVSTFGRLDMAFNNAGIAGPSGPIIDESGEAFDQVVAINLRGVWACMKHQLKHMRAQGSGAIVNCSSLGGLVGQTGRAAYHGTKHGVLGITKARLLNTRRLAFESMRCVPESSTRRCSPTSRRDHQRQ